MSRTGQEGHQHFRQADSSQLRLTFRQQWNCVHVSSDMTCTSPERTSSIYWGGWCIAQPFKNFLTHLTLAKSNQALPVTSGKQVPAGENFSWEKAEIRQCPPLPPQHCGTHSWRGNLILVRYQSGKICCLHRISPSTYRILTVLYLGAIQQSRLCREKKAVNLTHLIFIFSSKPCFGHTKYVFLPFNELSSFLLWPVFSSFILKCYNNKH